MLPQLEPRSESWGLNEQPLIIFPLENPDPWQAVREVYGLYLAVYWSLFAFRGLWSPAQWSVVWSVESQVPFENYRPVLGSREEIVIIDFEKTAKRRELYIQIMGEAPAGAQQPRQGPAPPGGAKPSAPPKKWKV